MTALASDSPRTTPHADGRGRSAVRTGIWVVALLVVLGLSVVFSVTLGPASITPSEAWGSILAHLGIGESGLSPLRDGIIWQLRMPRILATASVGAGLAVCGAIMQAVLRNPLADPYLLGLSSGASFGAVLVIVLGFSIALPVAAFGGALGALALTLLMAGAIGRMTASRTILASVAVSAALGALTSLVIFWSATGDSYREILGWLLGSLAGSTWPTTILALAAIVVAGAPLMFSAGTLDAFAFGDRAASSLGVSVERTRWILLAATALLTGCLVAVSGSIGFIGLVVPHAVRLIVGARHRVLLPVSALVGAIVLIWADTIARTLFDPRELPVGVVTALIGAPLFGLLLLRSRRIS